MGNAPYRLLAPALEAARKALRDLEEDQVPAELRRVTKHSGALTPPLAAALVKGLERYDWLREAAVEAWPELDPEAGGPDGMSAAFLQRPAGWVGHLIGLVAGHAAADAETKATQAEAATAAEREAVRDLRDRLSRDRQRAGRRARELERALEEERRARRALQAGVAREEAGARGSLDALAAEVERARSESAEAAAQLRQLREELRDERRARAEAEAAAAEAAVGGGWSAVDPESLAARLDDVALMARPAAGPESADGPAPELATGLPAGVRPDQSAAIEWLLAEAPPATVLVDGYNAGFVLAGAGNPAAARQRLELEASRLVALAAGRLAVVVVYDSDRGEGTRSPRRGGVEILFTDGRSADDVLVELTGDLAGRRVVISNDREVRDRSEAAGAVPLWADALAAWAGPGK